MQEAEEAGAEAEAERLRDFGLELERGVVELELREGVAKRIVLVGLDGIEPANTCGFTSLKPGTASSAGFWALVTVSPTRASLSSLMPATTKPTSPAESEVRLWDFGVKTPSCSTR